MKYFDRENGQEIQLNNIIGSDYWENTSGELYATDSIRGYAWPVRPSHALKSILQRPELRQSDEKVVRVQCCREFNSEAFRGHAENYLKNFSLDKITE